MSTHWTLGDDWTALRAEQCSTLLADMCYGINQRQAMAGLGVAAWGGGILPAIPTYPTPANFSGLPFVAAGVLITKIDVAINNLTANSTWYTDNTFATQMFHAPASYSTIKRIQDLSSWQALKAVFDGLKYLRILATNPSMAFTKTGYAYSGPASGDPWAAAIAAGIQNTSGTAPLQVTWVASEHLFGYSANIGKTAVYTLPTPIPALTGAGVIFQKYQVNAGGGITGFPSEGFTGTMTITQGTNVFTANSFSGAGPGLVRTSAWYDTGSGPTMTFTVNTPPGANPFYGDLTGSHYFDGVTGINTLYLRTDYDVSTALVKG